MRQLIAAALAAFMFLPLTAAAEGEEPTEEELETVTEEEVPPVYEYELDAEGNAQLTSFLESDTFTGQLAIPDEIDGHTVDYICNSCFMTAKGITEVMIPATVTDMDDSVFFECTALTAFTVDPDNSYYSTEDGILYADGGKMLTAYPAAKEDESFTIPDTVEEIGSGAFGFAQNLHEVIIGDNVTYINNWAFAYSALEKATVGSNVEEIDDFAFGYCDKLSSVTLQDGIQSINNASFANCPLLTQITLPDTLEYIGQYAFAGTGLSCVTIPQAVQEVSYCAFGYDADMQEIDDFIIYGAANSAAQIYASDNDEENEYENHFEFIAVEDANLPYELGEGRLLSDAVTDTVPAETDESGNIILQEDGTNGKASAEEEIGSRLKGNSRVKMILGVGGGAAVVLAVVLIISFFMKPKKDDTDETDDTDDKDETDDNDDTDDSGDDAA